jgi:hypothetical protein
VEGQMIYPKYQYWYVVTNDGRRFWAYKRIDKKSGLIFLMVVNQDGDEPKQREMVIGDLSGMSIRPAEEDKKYGGLRISKKT